MSDQARNYIKKLPHGRVSPETRAFLFFLADYHSVQKGYAWPGINTLAEDMERTVRQIQRYLSEAVAANLIEYTPGRGRGILGRFLYPELGKADVGVVFYGRKGDIKGDIKGDVDGRCNKEEPGTINQTLPNPPSCEGGNLSRRDLRQLRTQMQLILERRPQPTYERKDPDPNCVVCKGSGKQNPRPGDGSKPYPCACTFQDVKPAEMTFEQRLEEACRCLFLPIVAARRALTEAGIEFERKEPRSVTA